MTATLLPNAKQQFLDTNGRPLAGGTVYFYTPNTSSFKNTWQDAGKTVANPQPVVLDANGQAIIYGDGQYRQVVYDVHGNLIWDRLTDSPALNSEFQSFVSSISASSGSSLVGFIQSGLGAVARTVQDRLLDEVSAFDFMTPQQITAVRNGSVMDVTAALQAAINRLSQTQARTLVLPAGIYRYTKLYCYYDAVLNPGFNIDRDGEITLSGDGTSSENGGSCGTILLCTATSDDGFVVSPATEDTLPYRSRDFLASGISFQGNTSGSLVLARGVPGASFFNCEFIQNHLNGNGLWITTSYFGVLEKCRFQNLASGTKTGDAIKFGTTISAGLFTLRDCNISGYANGLNMYAGDWQLLSIADSEVSGTAYAIYANGNIQIFNCARTYFEGTCTSFIADSASNRIKNLVMIGCWSYGAGLTGPAINLAGPNSVQIIGGYSQDQNNTYLNIAATPSGGTSGYAVFGTSFPRTTAAPSAITLFTGVLPEFHGVDYASSDPNMKLYNSTARPVVVRNNFATSSYTASGHVFGTSMLKTGAVSGGSIDLQAVGFPSFVTCWCLTTPTTLNLPAISAGLPNGFDCTITSDTNSTANILVKTAVADGAVQIAALVPGQQRLFKFFNDGTTTGWN